MTWKVSADPVDFDEAIAWFRKRVGMTKADFERLTAAAKRKAFTVANVAQLDLVSQTWAAIDEAIKKGTPLADFKKAIGAELRAAWQGKVDDPAWRLETVFRTNVQLAYGAGRFKQATHPDVASDRPVWMFDAILDGRETDICHACDGTKLPSDDDWWKSHLPPLHFNCRSSFTTLSEAQAGKITFVRPTASPLEGFGLPPTADEWQPDLKKYPKQLSLPFEQKQQAAPPPPPPSRLKDGVHFNTLSKVSAVKQELVDELLDAISDAETLKWFAANPLAELKFRERIPGARGMYVSPRFSPTGRRWIEIAVDRDATSYNRPWEPGKTFSISSSMPNRNAAIKATMRHEFGHHVGMLGGRGSTVDKLIEAAYRRARVAGVFITDYAKSDRDEYFAESYAAYYLRRSDLKKHDPNGFKMVEDVLKLRGIS